MLELSRSIFYHIPKTGGTWVRNTLLNSCVGSKGMLSHIWEIDYPKGNKKAFTFVRHPFTWYESSYWYENTHKTINNPWIFCKYRSEGLDNCVKEMVSKHPGWISDYVKAFCVNMDFIGRQETLVEDLIKILDVCNEPYDKDRLLAMPPQHVGNYTPGLSDQSKELITHSEHYLIERFYKDG